MNTSLNATMWGCASRRWLIIWWEGEGGRASGTAPAAAAAGWGDAPHLPPPPPTQLTCWGAAGAAAAGGGPGGRPPCPAFGVMLAAITQNGRGLVNPPPSLSPPGHPPSRPEAPRRGAELARTARWPCSAAIAGRAVRKLLAGWGHRGRTHAQWGRASTVTPHGTESAGKSGRVGWRPHASRAPGACASRADDRRAAGSSGR